MGVLDRGEYNGGECPGPKDPERRPKWNELGKGTRVCEAPGTRGSPGGHGVRKGSGEQQGPPQQPLWASKTHNLGHPGTGRSCSSCDCHCASVRGATALLQGGG